MTPRVARRGSSFVGAGKYYLHDKKAGTSERVAWSHTRNLRTEDAGKAMKAMAWTAMHAQELKERAGVSAKGRKASQSPVYAYSLAWHPDEQPDRQTMMAAALATLDRLGLSEHETVIVAHSDTAHPHCHVIVNLVHPETGRTASVSKDHEKLSDWAAAYEREHNGRLLCENRDPNSRRRMQYRDEKEERRRLLTQLYTRSDSAKAFQTALEEQGYTLAKGERRAYVVVDGEGTVYSLSRHLKDHRAKDIAARLSSLDETLPQARALSEERRFYDREQDEINRQNRLSDAAMQAAQEKAKAEDQERRVKGKAARPEERWSRSLKLPRTRSAAEQLDALREIEYREDAQRQWTEKRIDEAYGIKETDDELARLKAELMRPLSIRKRREIEDQITAAEKTQANAKMRAEEMRGATEKKIEQERPRQPYKAPDKTPDPANENTPTKETEAEFIARMQSYTAAKQVSRDRDRGLDREP